MVTCDKGNYTKWIATIFGECVYTPREKASFYIGLSSILCWLVAQVPQLIQNYRKQSATALSVLFLVEWLCGDGFNLLGAIITQQLPTQISTAVYFLVMDIILTLQWGYYTIKKRIARRELLPLIKDDTGMGDRNGDHTDDQHTEVKIESRDERENNHPQVTSDIIEDESYEHKKERELIPSDENESPNNNDKNRTGNKSLAVIPFLLIGSFFVLLPNLNDLFQEQDAISISPARRNLQEISSEKGGLPSTPVDWAGYAIGIVSSIFYLGSRIPQIVRNYRRKSTKGLSFLLNTFAALGNITYGISIFLFSVEGDFLLAKAPWLAGSLGTLVFDATILTQMVIYRNAKEVDEYENVKEEIVDES
eukprot:gb/GECH01008410.1/.p1 GENE.gb/GECH01008410.1/~~gb/GECH01008410.1/.p1  ORF type:complete len:364 (+),score=80.21 gb/GECH01008410.1/:1-1092(+)